MQTSHAYFINSFTKSTQKRKQKIVTDIKAKFGGVGVSAVSLPQQFTSAFKGAARSNRGKKKKKIM